VSTRTASAFALTDDELQIVGARLGVADFPVVLAIRPRHGTHAGLAQAHESATARLTARGLIESGDVACELADLLDPLRRPARELAVRLVTPDGIARITVAQSGACGVLARRIGNDVHLRAIDERGGLAAATQAVTAELPAADPVQVDAFGAPSAELAVCLNGGHDATYLTDRLRALGAGQQAAMTLGSAFASRLAFAEIVCHALDSSTDRVVRVPGAVAVFYTKRGRLVSAPSMSPGGQLWTTIKPGSDHRLAQAISQLAELAPGGWEGDAQ
jgi:hypothetical protein